MKKKNLKALKLNKKSISQLHGNAINGGSSYVPSYLCTINNSCGCPTDNCQPTEHEAICPSSWIYLCRPCDVEPQ